jgi:hypothetical protein
MAAFTLPNPQLILLAAAVVGGLILLILITKFLARRGTDAGYRSRERVLTPAERSFFGALEMALSKQYRVLPKIRLADLIGPPRGSDRRAYQSAFNRIAAKHADFTICRESDLAILGVIELDDQSHDRADRQARDRFLEQALQSAGIPLLRIKAARGYDTALLSSQLTALLNPKTPVASSQ